MASVVTNLDNSVKTAVVFEEDKNLPIASMQLVFKSSGSIEDGDKPGLAKVVAKLLSEGTKKMGSSAFAHMLESQAIYLSAHVGTETFVFELSALKEKFAQGIKAFESLLKDPNFTQETLDKVKTKMIGSLKQKEHDFDDVASKALKALLYKGTALEHPESGTVKSIASITLEDVQAFYKKHMVQERAVAVIGGMLSLDDAKKYIHTLVQALPNGTAAALPNIAITAKKAEKIIKKNTQQAYVYFGAPFYVSVDSPDYYKARVALYILGTGGFGTRLMEEIRVKRGLAYSAYARMSVNNSHQYLTGYLQTKIESGKEALEIVKAEFKRFVNEGVTQEELDAAKMFLLGSEPLRTETLAQRLSRTFMAYYKGLPLDSATQELTLIEGLSLKDLNEFITKHPEILELSVVTVTK